MTMNLNIDLKVPKTKLIEALAANKAKHQADYQKAVEGFFSDLSDSIFKLQAEVAAQNVSHHFYLNPHKPVNNSANYDKYIGFFLLSVEEEIQISAHDYGCIVEDNWDWAISALASNSFYSSKVK